MSTAPATTPPTPGKALLILLGINVPVGIFVALNHVLGIGEFWSGFLFLLYWGAIEHMKFERLPAAIGGAAAGLLLAYLLLLLPQWMGTAGLCIILALILFVLYSMLMQWLPVLINTATMLFLLVGTIPTIQTHGDFIEMFAGLGFGLVYFAGLYWLLVRFQQRSATPAPV